MRPLFIASLVFLSACCTSIEEFQQEREAAQACNEGDTCVLAGSAQCLCAAPVNASQAERIEAAADDVCCGGIAVDCVAFTNPRCENGKCVADIL